MDKKTPAESFVAFVSKYGVDKTNQDQKNLFKAELYRECANISVSRAPRWASSKLLHQAIWNTSKRTKLLDFKMDAVPLRAEEGTTFVPPELEVWTRMGFSTVLKRAGFDESFYGKGGVLFNSLLYGNGYRLINFDPEDGFNLEFIPVANSNVYVSTQATTWIGGNKPVTEIAVVFSGTKDEFYEKFPDAPEGICGQLPRNDFTWKETGQTTTQRFNAEEDIVEWAYYYKFSGKKKDWVYAKFAGGDVVSIGEPVTGDDYPFVFKDADGVEKPFNPVSCYLCIPASEGIYDYGLGDLFYDFSQIKRRIGNRMITSIDQNVLPDTIVGMTQDQHAEFFGAVQDAQRMRESGQSSFITVSQDSGAPLNVTPLLNQGDIDGAIALQDRIDLECKRVGVYLDEPESKGITATQIRIDTEQALSFPQLMMRYNQAMFERELYVVKFLIEKYAKKTDKTPLNITAFQDPESGDMVSPASATLGELAMVLRKNHFFFTVNGDSGAVPSRVLETAELDGLMAMTQPGTPEQNYILKQRAQSAGVQFPKAVEQQSAQMAQMPLQGQPPVA